MAAWGKLVTGVSRFPGVMTGWLQRVLFPPVCLGCSNLVTEPGSLCPSCWGRLRFLERPWCPVMGTPFSVDHGENMLSAEAIANPPPFARARSAVVYQGVARKLAQGLKFRDRTDLAPWMARWMLRAGGELLPDGDLVIPVPLHRARFLARRFNQSAELARAVAREGRLDYAPEALVRVRSTRQQVGLGTASAKPMCGGLFVCLMRRCRRSNRAASFWWTMSTPQAPRLLRPRVF